MALWSILLEILGKPSVWEVIGELAMFVVSLWIVVIVGVLVGWVWKPKLANLGREMFVSDNNAGVFSPSFLSIPSFISLKLQLPSYVSWISDESSHKGSFSEPPSLKFDSSASSSKLKKEKSGGLDDDLEYLYKPVEEKEGGSAWIQMMDRFEPTMGYKAWQRDLQTGPPQYCSSTVF